MGYPDELVDRAHELSREGTRFLAAGETDRGVAMVEKAVELVPSTYFRVQLGLAFVAAGRITEADEQFVKADPDGRNSGVLTLRSDVANRRGERAASASLLEAAVVLDWSDEPAGAQARAWRMLGDARRALGQIEQADDAYRRAAALDESDWWSRSRLAIAATDRREFSEAERLIDEAIAINPLAATPRTVKAYLLFFSGRVDEAETPARLGAELS